MNGEGEGVPIRPPAIAELEVDTLDRYGKTLEGEFNRLLTPTSSSSILFPAQQSLLSGYFTRIAVSSFQLFWRTPTINPYNNRFTVSEYVGMGAIPYQITMPIGFYDLSGIATTMVAQLNAVNNRWRAQLITTTNTAEPFIRITNTANNPWGFDFAAPTSNQVNKRIFKFYDTVGITSLNFTPPDPAVPTAVSQDFAQTASLIYTPYVDIVSDRLGKFAKVKDNMTRQVQGQTNVLARIYLTPFNSRERFIGDFPLSLAVNYSAPKYIRWNPEEYINDFDLSLYDQYGDLLWCDPVNYPQYVTEYQFTLQASET